MDINPLSLDIEIRYILFFVIWLRNGGDEDDDEDDADEGGDDNEDEYFYDTEEFFDDDMQKQRHARGRRRNRKQKQSRQQRRLLLVAGAENTLKFEQRYHHQQHQQQQLNQATYLDLKLVSWNDSSAMEVRDTSEMGQSGVDEVQENLKANLLRATARWDSSEHKSKYLNRETPLDAHVYLIVKCNVKFKLYSAEWAIRRHEHCKDL